MLPESAHSTPAENNLRRYCGKWKVYKEFMLSTAAVGFYVAGAARIVVDF
jgi:hypothetical protein